MFLLLCTTFNVVYFLSCPSLSIITVLTPVSCYNLTSFNYGSKKAKDVDLTCRCHLSNIMLDSIFYDSMEWGITEGFFRGGNHCLPQQGRYGLSLITITPMVLGKP